MNTYTDRQKACPFCGSTDISEGEVLTSNPDGGASTQSMCRGCGALGPDAHLRDGEIDYGSVKATAAWNRRAVALESTSPMTGFSEPDGGAGDVRGDAVAQETPLELLDSILSDLEDGFVRCQRCGAQEDTATLDVVPILRELRTMLAAPLARASDAQATPLVDFDLYLGCYSAPAQLADRIAELEAMAQALRGTDAQILFERKLTCEAIDGAMAFGYLNTNPAPEGEWLAPYWAIGRKLAEAAAQATAAHAGATLTDEQRDNFDVHVKELATKYALDRTAAGGWIFENHNLFTFVYAALAAAPSQPAAPATETQVATHGWKLVPTKDDKGRAGLTDKMMRAFYDAVQVSSERGDFERLNVGYNAMLAAAPTPVADSGATDAAYFERNQVVAGLAKCFPPGTAKTAIDGWDEAWHGCVYIDLPTGQVSWHYHEREAWLFADLPPYIKKWDGHDTPEKYRRVNALAAAKPVSLDATCQCGYSLETSCNTLDPTCKRTVSVDAGGMTTPVGKVVYGEIYGWHLQLEGATWDALKGQTLYATGGKS